VFVDGRRPISHAGGLLLVQTLSVSGLDEALPQRLEPAVRPRDPRPCEDRHRSGLHFDTAAMLRS
jgi:hypothetical protein